MATPLAPRAERAVAHVMAVTGDDDLLYSRVLEAIGEALDCLIGAVWEPDPETGTIGCVEMWSAPGFDGGRFAGMTRTLRLEPGAGLPGRVWQSGEPVWIAELEDDPNFPRAGAAARAGLRSAFCFPLRSPQGILGAVELFTGDPRRLDEDLIATMASLGGQIGQLVARRRAELSVRESDERKRAILAAALDCVITIDHRGRVVEFNPAAEDTFGYPAGEAIGRDMAELIVPPSLRRRHREGFTRYLETGEGTVLGHRIEITGMRSDGTQFPVELAITRINLPGPPMFTGYLRDITERKIAEAELRASRARIVQAADAERRRIERDLHDGAQQRLVHLGLMLRVARNRLEAGRNGGLAALDEAIAELSGATAELRELARGIHPAVLSDGGLAPALATLVERSRPRARLVEAPEGRLPAAIEATAYFVVAEALTNTTRHAHAAEVTVTAGPREGGLFVEVRDDGGGGADPNGSGLRGLADRLAALGGELDVVSGEGAGTTVRAWIPSA